MVLNEMREFVANRYGYKAWVETLRRSGHQPTMHHELSQIYPDAELSVIAASAAQVTGTPLPALVEAFGEAMLPDLMRTYSYLVDPSWTYDEFVMHLEPLLVQVLRLHTAGTTQTKLQVKRRGSGLLEVVYDSPLRACAAVHGVLVAAAREYGAKAEIDHVQCVLRGEPACVFEIRIDAPPAAGQRP